MAPKTKALLTSLLAGGLCLTAVAGSYSVQRSQRLSEIERDTRLVTLQSADRLSGALEKHRIALDALAFSVQSAEDISEEKFQDLAARALAQTPLCVRLSAIDQGLRARWGYPALYAGTGAGLDVRDNPESLETLKRAVETRRCALSAPLKLPGGDDGFSLISPEFKNGEFIGAVTCSLKSSDFFTAITIPEVLERYEQSLDDGGVVLFDSALAGRRGPALSPASASFEFGGRTWQVKVTPRREGYAARLDSGLIVFWGMGCLLTLAAAGAAFAGACYLLGAWPRLDSHEEIPERAPRSSDGAMQRLMQAEKLTALGELVAGVAHEINNPLASILGYTQLTLSKELPAEARRRLQTVSSEAERAGRIVSNLLSFAREHPAEKRYLGLNGVIEKTLELKAYHFRVNQIRLKKDLAPELPKTMFDFHQIQQVLLNLLKNAEQALAESGNGGTIRVSSRLESGRIEVRISDSGPGIPEAIQRKIFEPFFTTKREGKGTGLGLSLCFGIMQEHGGRIEVESRPGTGATFVLQLPVVQGSDDEAAAAGRIPADTGSSSANLKVFIVDDEPNVQGFLVELMGARGHAVDTASDVPEAMRKLAANHYDLIIADMRMPHGTGKDIYHAVERRDPALARRIIFTTGDGASAQTQAFAQRMGNQILLKPFSLEAIDRAMSATLGS